MTTNHLALPDIIIEKQAEIAKLCERFGVGKLELFGSATSDQFDPDKSDFDFIVEFADTSPGYAERYLGFADPLEVLVERNIDIMSNKPIRNPYLKLSVDESRVTIYESARRKTPV